MNAINQITGILAAMGTKPETITRPDGETIIKVNAPTIGGAKEEPKK